MTDKLGYKGALTMGKDSHLLFNSIAPVYGLFYKLQKARYGAVVDRVSGELDLASFNTVLDVGCGVSGREKM